MKSKNEFEIDGEVETLSVRKVSNGYVITVESESESKEVVCSKRIHVLKAIKELFKE